MSFLLIYQMYMLKSYSLNLQEGIAIGRSFAIAENTPHDGNKEMVAFGLMNLMGSFTSCYLTSGMQMHEYMYTPLSVLIG